MTENEKRNKRVCFTGHRTEKLNVSELEAKEKLTKVILDSIKDGYYVFISGMARGIDIWAAEIILDLQSKGYDIKLICAVPYKGFEQYWSSDWKTRYQKIISSCYLARYISPNYSNRCFQIRNEWMVNHSSKVIAFYNGEKGGTRNTILYAQKENVYVSIIQ
ncbi:MAG: DUF1273 domain-containing protein [Ruminococcaceae bacterium]|nr:DUF1273 domain-containing protein [Oscillospiraceae bacterium]